MQKLLEQKEAEIRRQQEEERKQREADEKLKKYNFYYKY